jgi:hypothetical protein
MNKPTDIDQASRLSATHPGKIQEIGRAINAQLPEGYGFILVISAYRTVEPKTENETNTADYIATVNREDAIGVLKTCLFRWGINEQWMEEC